MVGVIHSRVVLITFVIGLILGVTVVVQASQYVLPSDAEGTQISETIFRNLEGNGKSPVFDMTGMETYDPTFRIDSSLWNQSLISLSEARNAAYTFLSSIFDEATLQNLSIPWSHISGPRPTWVLQIEGSYITTQMHVNAITGEVIGWNLSTLTMNAPDSYHENGSSIISEIAEQSAFEFLEEHNYSIPYNARYFGSIDFPSDPYNYYVIFRHFEGVIPVGMYPINPDCNPDYSYEGIILRVNKINGVVTQFGYRWTKVGQIPNTGIISEWDSNTVTQNHFESENVTILTTKIVLTYIESLESSDGSPQTLLVWVNYVVHDGVLVLVFVDSYSGEVIQELRTRGPPPFTVSSDPDIPNVTLPIVSGLGVGIVFAILTNHYIRKRYSS